jgi:hypothetical protein
LLYRARHNCQKRTAGQHLLIGSEVRIMCSFIETKFDTFTLTQAIDLELNCGRA